MVKKLRLRFDARCSRVEERVEEVSEGFCIAACLAGLALETMSVMARVGAFESSALDVHRVCQSCLDGNLIGFRFMS